MAFHSRTTSSAQGKVQVNEAEVFDGDDLNEAQSKVSWAWQWAKIEIVCLGGSKEVER
jgi:hypothetical protein